MVSVCLRCHQVIEDGTICCAELRYTWQCLGCQQMISGFVVPFGKCFLCGGDLEMMKAMETDRPEVVRVIEDALQYELNTLQFYRMARIKAKDPHQRAVFERFKRMERGHIVMLERKYHIHLDPRVLDMPFDAEQSITGWLFEGIDFDVPQGSLRPLYEQAITMERRTRDHFRQRAASLPAGTERDLCQELAEEEDGHVSILEAELAEVDAGHLPEVAAQDETS